VISIVQLSAICSCSFLQSLTVPSVSPEATIVSQHRAQRLRIGLCMDHYVRRSLAPVVIRVGYISLVLNTCDRSFGISCYSLLFIVRALVHHGHSREPPSCECTYDLMCDSNSNQRMISVIPTQLLRVHVMRNKHVHCTGLTTCRYAL
jgi:hypothetical protein